MTQESETELWTVHAADGREFRCVMRFAAGGVEVAISDGMQLVASRVFRSGTEAYSWAEDVREEMAEG
jgi:hypothetical protein